MERKPVSSRVTSNLLTIISAIIISGLCGCEHKVPGSGVINREINVYGVQLFSETDYKSIESAVPVKEPCVKGFEYIYDSLNISVGYSFNGYIRKITTLNKNNSMFDIRVGDSFRDGTDKILKHGFKLYKTPYSFVKDWCTFTLMINEKQKVFGMRIEVLD